MNGRDAAGRRVILERVVGLLEGVLATPPQASIDERTGLLGQGIGLDSIEILALVSAIEGDFDVTIDESDLHVSHFRTVGSLVTFIAERLRSTP